MSVNSFSPKAQQWLERFHRFQQSERTVLQFCQAEGGSQPSFYQWKRKLTQHLPGCSTRKKRSGDKGQPVDAPQGPAVFRAVKIVPFSQTHALTIDLPGGIQIHVTAEESVTQTVLEKLLPAAKLSGASRLC